MNYNYYIISFQNMKTWEFKEYYQFISSEDIEEKARDLRDKFFTKDDIINIHIYKLEKTICQKELWKNEDQWKDLPFKKMG